MKNKVIEMIKEMIDGQQRSRTIYDYDDDIFSLVNYGNGFTFSDVYFMPVHLRNYYIKLLVDTKKKEEKAYTNARRGVRGK